MRVTIGNLLVKGFNFYEKFRKIGRKDEFILANDDILEQKVQI